MTGGPPVRGALLPYWVPDGALTATERRTWITAAERIASGIATLAHLDAFVDVEAYRVGFGCDGDLDLVIRYVEAIGSERIAAVSIGDEIFLPCHPAATDEEITHVVLAVMKASHALEFPVMAEVSAATSGGESTRGSDDAAV